MTLYDDDIARAIKNKFAPDFMTALQQATSMEIANPMRTVTLPMRADLAIVYDAGLAGFSVKARASLNQKAKNPREEPKWFLIEQIFSSREIVSAKEAADLIEYLFDNAKREFIRALADGEIEHLFKKKP